MITACILARNEEKNLPRVIASVRAVADEVLVCDTGSSDGTVALAQSLGARVTHFPWRDDFGAAINHTIADARGDWILRIDADEELLPESVPELRACVTTPDALGFYILRQDLVRADDPSAFTEMWQLRLFRRRPDLRFLGRCHADFRPPLEETARAEGKVVYRTRIRFRHHGYTVELLPEKLRRAARLLALELAERPGQLYYLIEYGRTLLLLGDVRGHDAISEATRLLHAQRDTAMPQPIAAALIEHLLLSPPEACAPFRSDELRALARRWFPRSPPLLWAIAQQDYAAGSFVAAAAGLEDLVRLGRTGDYDHTMSFDPRILGGDALLNLGVCHVRLGALGKAEKCFRTLLANPSHRQRAEQNLFAIKSLRRKGR